MGGWVDGWVDRRSPRKNIARVETQRGLSKMSDSLIRTVDDNQRQGNNGNEIADRSWPKRSANGFNTTNK